RSRQRALVPEPPGLPRRRLRRGVRRGHFGPWSAVRPELRRELREVPVQLRAADDPRDRGLFGPHQSRVRCRLEGARRKLAAQARHPARCAPRVLRGHRAGGRAVRAASARAFEARGVNRMGRRLVLAAARNLRVWRNWQDAPASEAGGLCPWRFDSSHPYELFPAHSAATVAAATPRVSSPKGFVAVTAMPP